LAIAGNAPKVFARCTRKGVPYYALATSAMFSVLSYLNLSATGIVVFNWFVNLINTGAYLSWICACLIYLRFRKVTAAQGIEPTSLPYRSILQPYMAYVSGGVFSFLLLLNGMAVFFPGHWNTSTFITCYIGVVILLGFYFVHRFTLGRKDPWMRPLQEVDMVSGLAEIIADEEMELQLEPRKRFQVWRYLWE
jgi:amino acid transporter